MPAALTHTPRRKIRAETHITLAELLPALDRSGTLQSSVLDWPLKCSKRSSTGTSDRPGVERVRTGVGSQAHTACGPGRTTVAIRCKTPRPAPLAHRRRGFRKEARIRRGRR